MDDARSPDTHWVAYAKRDNHMIYFDSFDNLQLPKKLVRYFGNDKDRVQSNALSNLQSICGQLSAVSSNDRCVLI